jgi:hypothetical protein
MLFQNSLIVRKNEDINRIPQHSRKVYIVGHLSFNRAKLLLERCPNLEKVVLTRTVKKNASRKALRYFFKRGVGVITDYSGRGRPVGFSRQALVEMRTMRENGFTYSEIAAAIGVSMQTVRRALNGSIKFIRWREDYYNDDAKVVWMETHDADPRARMIADRHYSRKTPGAKFFCGPGEKLILITPDYRALFVWRKNRIRWDGQHGVECTLFRNEGAGVSSELIQEAVRLARKRWPGERLFTYVRPSKVRSRSPGYCFLSAGWKIAGRNSGKKHRLLILEAPEQ